MAQARRNKKNKTPAWVLIVIGVLLGFFFSHVDFLQAYRFLEASIEKTQKSQRNVAMNHAKKEETKFDFYNILSEKSSAQESKLDLDDSKELNAPNKQRQTHQEVLSDLDAATHTRLPPLQKGSITQLPELSKPVKTIENSAKTTESVQPQVQKNSSAPLDEKSSQVESREKYILHISAKSYAAADRLKAQLLLMGFQGIRIQKVVKDQDIFFHITVGNYSNAREAESVKQRLKQNSIGGVVVSKKSIALKNKFVD